MIEVVETHAYQFLLGEYLRTFARESPPTRNKVSDAFIFPLYLGVVTLSQ